MLSKFCLVSILLHILLLVSNLAHGDDQDDRGSMTAGSKSCTSRADCTEHCQGQANEHGTYIYPDCNSESKCDCGPCSRAQSEAGDCVSPEGEKKTTAATSTERPSCTENADCTTYCQGLADAHKKKVLINCAAAICRCEECPDGRDSDCISPAEDT